MVHDIYIISEYLSIPSKKVNLQFKYIQHSHSYHQYIWSTISKSNICIVFGSTIKHVLSHQILVEDSNQPGFDDSDMHVLFFSRIWSFISSSHHLASQIEFCTNFVGIVQNPKMAVPCFHTFQIWVLHLSPIKKMANKKVANKKNLSPSRQRPKHLQKNLATVAIKNTWRRHFETLKDSHGDQKDFEMSY